MVHVLFLHHTHICLISLPFLPLIKVCGNAVRRRLLRLTNLHSHAVNMTDHVVRVVDGVGWFRVTKTKLSSSS